jgi:hypothetical protein
MFEDEHLQPMAQNMMIMSTCVLEPGEGEMLPTPRRFGSSGGGLVLAMASRAVVGLVSPRLLLSCCNCGGGDSPPLLQPCKVSLYFILIPMCIFAGCKSLNSWIFYVH